MNKTFMYYCFGIIAAMSAQLFWFGQFSFILITLVVLLSLFKQSKHSPFLHSPEEQQIVVECSPVKEITETQIETPMDKAIKLCAKNHMLTAREEDVLELLSRGRNSKIICQKLHVSSGTAKTHISSVYKKLGVCSHQELIDYIELTME